MNNSCSAPLQCQLCEKEVDTMFVVFIWSRVGIEHMIFCKKGFNMPYG